MTSRLVLGVAAVLPLLAASVTALSAAEYAIDPGASNVQFSVPVMAVSKVTGKFMRYDVKIAAGRARDLSQAKVTAVIEMASVDTGSDTWDGKLRTPAFFDAAKYPEIRFESKRVRKSGARWRTSGSSTSRPIPRRRAGEASACSARSRAGCRRN